MNNDSTKPNPPRHPKSFELIAEIDELAASMKCELSEIADGEIMSELRRITGWTVDDVGEMVKLRRALGSKAR